MLTTRRVDCRTVKTDDIYYIQDGMRPFGRDSRAPIVCRNPWQVVAFHPDIQACTGQPRRFADQATVKSLRDGREQRVALWVLKQCEQMGLEAF